MASLILKNPTVAISEAESKRLAGALANVAKQYDMRFNPAVVAWMQLAGVSTAIYAPRIAVNIAQKKQARAQARTNATLQAAGTQAPQKVTMGADGGSVSTGMPPAQTAQPGMMRFQ